ncbi:MAG: hypothetical protein LBO05_14945 [Deltaproteobacteria bacterium]|jgi:hypothetical protein|nr:hypothetical protein [Deltaproteobacteria bacterium]
MWEMISLMGPRAYFEQYPLNPISIVGAAVIIGIIVLIVNSKVRKSASRRYLLDHPGSATVVLAKVKTGGEGRYYGDNIRPLRLNGEKAHWFFIRPMTGAIFLKPGRNSLVVRAQWTQGGGFDIKIVKSPPVTLDLVADVSARYSLEYLIPEERYIFTKLPQEY